jgi:hypothetical protein
MIPKLRLLKGEKRRRRRRRIGVLGSLQSGSFLRSWLMVWLNVEVWFLKICADGLLSRVTNFDSSSLWFCSLGFVRCGKVGKAMGGGGRGKVGVGCEDVIATTIQGRNECQQNKREGDVESDTWKVGSMKCFSNCQVVSTKICVEKPKPLCNPIATATAAAIPLSFHQNLHHSYTHFDGDDHHHDSSCNKIKFK